MMHTQPPPSLAWKFQFHCWHGSYGQSGRIEVREELHRAAEGSRIWVRTSNDGGRQRNPASTHNSQYYVLDADRRIRVGTTTASQTARHRIAMKINQLGTSDM